MAPPPPPPFPPFHAPVRLDCYSIGLSARFFEKPYIITVESILIKNELTGKSYIGKYENNQFTIPIEGGLSSEVLLDIIDPDTNRVVDTINNQITFSLGEIIKCTNTNQKGPITTSYESQLSGFSQYFGSINIKVILDGQYKFANFPNKITSTFQTSLNGEDYSIVVKGLYIQKA